MASKRRRVRAPHKVDGWACWRLGHWAYTRRELCHEPVRCHHWESCLGGLREPFRRVPCDRWQ